MDDNSGWVVYGHDQCSFCKQIMKLLDERHQIYEYRNVRLEDLHRRFLKANHLLTVPQVYLNGEKIGGFEATKEYLNQYV